MTTDQTIPEGKWAFDAAVTEAFDDMLERSIPAYNVMRELTTALALDAARRAQASPLIVDLGVSRGAGLRPLTEAIRDPHAVFVGTDVSESMLAAAESTFRRDERVRIRNHDLRSGIPDIWPAADVTLAVLTLQFTPIEYRQRILADVYRHTAPGGAFLVVEKVLGAGAVLHDVFDAEYLAMKRRNGYTDEQVVRKKASLEGVLVSTSAATLVDWLYGAGFRSVDCYYRWLNFGGWIAVR